MDDAAILLFNGEDGVCARKGGGVVCVENFPGNEELTLVNTE